jgi:hypothetical protein
MKNIFRFPIVILLITILFATGCDKSKLDETPKGTYSPENLYVSSSGFNAGVNALYDAVRKERNFQRRLPSMLVGTDLCYGALTHSDWTELTNYSSLSPSFLPGNDCWAECYKTIAWANLIIEKAQNDNVKWTNTDDKARFTAEARFFRAYNHNLLTCLFNDIPIVNKFYAEPKLDFTRNPQKDVLAFVKEDLIYAAANLPSNPATVERGRLTKFTALHLLAQVYIHLGEYTNAIKAAQDVIDGPFQLMTARFGAQVNNPSGNVFNDLFLEKNVDYRDGNRETIWVMKAQYGAIGGSTVGQFASQMGDWSRRDLVAFYQNVPGLKIADSLGGRGIGRVGPTAAFLNLYGPGDMRNENNNIRRNWYYNNAATLPAGKKLGDLVTFDPAASNFITMTTINMYPTVTKFDFGVQGRGGPETYLGMDKDRAQYRLAETYLLLAEAKLLNNDKAGAAIALNAVRSRSKALSVSGAEVNMNFILDERARELYGEEFRRITLARTGMFLERVKAMNPQVAASVADKNKFFPIPQTVIDGNPGAKFPQNPGY